MNVKKYLLQFGMQYAMNVIRHYTMLRYGHLHLNGHCLHLRLNFASMFEQTFEGTFTVTTDITI